MAGDCTRCPRSSAKADFKSDFAAWGELNSSVARHGQKHHDGANDCIARLESHVRGQTGMRGQAEMHMKEEADMIWFKVCEMQKRYLQSRCQKCVFTAQAV